MVQSAPVNPRQGIETLNQKPAHKVIQLASMNPRQGIETITSFPKIFSALVSINEPSIGELKHMWYCPCLWCKHYRIDKDADNNDEERDGLKTCVCDAFPSGIPAVMTGGHLEPRFRRKKPISGKDGWSSNPHADKPWFFDHNYPYPGDNGIRFEHATEEDMQKQSAIRAALRKQHEQEKGDS
jgi:hypothetical protein